MLKFTFPMACSPGKEQQKILLHVWIILINTGMLQPLLSLASIKTFFSTL